MIALDTSFFQWQAVLAARYPPRHSFIPIPQQDGEREYDEKMFMSQNKDREFTQWLPSQAEQMSTDSAQTPLHVLQLQYGAAPVRALRGPCLLQASFAAALWAPAWLHVEIFSAWCTWAAGGQPASLQASPGCRDLAMYTQLNKLVTNEW